MGQQRSRAACDLCYSRKVKCDREEQCKTCRVAQVECQRTRPVRPARSRQSKISALAKRLAALESSSRAPDSPTHQPVQEQMHLDSYVDEGELDDANSPEKRHNVTQAEPMGQSLGAHETILESLGDCAGINSTRARVLEAAIHTIYQISNTGPTIPVSVEESTDPTIEQTNSPELFRPEFLYMIAPGDNDRWQDHISKGTLERMVFSLMERKEHEQVLFQYQVCVYSKEIFRMSRWSTVCQNQELSKQLERSQNYYKAAALTALKQINVLSSPSLTLLQSLLSGAMLMQFLGNMSQSWMLTSFAARTITFLNYQSLNPNTSNEGDIEIHACVFWCHYLDKILSSLFMKPPSLPKLAFNPVLLLHLDSSSSSDVIRFMGHMACILERALEVQLQTNQSMSKEQPAAVLDSLIDETNDLRTRIDNFESSGSNIAQNNRIAAEFCHYTMLNNLFQSRFRLLQYEEDQRKCLENARNALSIFVDLQNNALASNPSQPDSSFLTWTILLFPLRPFFSLFCNVVRSSNTQDMQLMQNATSALDPFKRFIPAARLHRLFEILLDLCRPLFSADMEASGQFAAVVVDTATSAVLEDNIEQLDTNGKLTSPNCPNHGTDATGYPVGSEETVSSIPWGEEQMLDLFNSEPCLEWLETVSFSLAE